ncbi:2-keto-4-pentenoate hydratase [Cerasibacillus terrae]|nr:fumarylacetoacetate hydrolase family protein [Cerasibacillus terrae]
MTDKIDMIVNKLLNAYKTGIPIDFIRNEITLDEQTSYKIQDVLVKKKCALFNEEIAGYKISMTSPETQKLANTNEPAYGTITTSSLLKSTDSLSLTNMNKPLVEPEIMFILTDDISMGATEEEILAHSKLTAGLEIPDSRYKNWFPNFTLQDLLCDNGVMGKVVIADEVAPPSFEALAKIEMELFYNGEKISEGIASNVLENPASSVAWLTQKLAKQGKNLKKGMVISSGTFISPIPVEEGIYEANFTGLGNVNILLKS